MLRSRSPLFLAFVLAFVVVLVSASAGAAPRGATVLFEERTTELPLARSGPAVAPFDKEHPSAPELFVSPSVLEQVTGFVLKPEGVCRDEMCIPVVHPATKKSLVTEAGAFSLVSFAARLGQPVVADSKRRVWVFGKIPAGRRAFSEDGQAPELVLRTTDDEVFRLSRLRGTKVLLLTWASW